MGISRVLNCLCFSNGASSMCLCLGSENIEGDGEERRGLIQNNRGHVMRIRDIISEERDRLAFQLMPQMVILRVSLHCKGCAKQVGKHISKIEGVTSFAIDLETKKVTVVGDITPLEVLQSVSRIRNAQLWESPRSLN